MTTRLWEKLTKETESKDLESIMIIPKSGTEQGFELYSHNTIQDFNDFDGMLLPIVAIKEMGTQSE